MQYLTKRGSLLGGLVLSLGFQPLAFALGTDSGTVVTNSVSLAYQVNSVAQTGSSSVAFTVDRKLNVAVVTQNANWVSVIPGQTATPGTTNSLNYLVSNRTNEAARLRVALVDRSTQAVTGFTAQGGSPAVFPPTPSTGTMWNDLNNNNLIDGAETSVALSATGITVLALPSLNEDASTNINVVVNVTNAAVANQYRSFTLVAAVADSGGSALTADSSGNVSPGGTASNVANNLNAVESVFADAGSANAEDIRFNFIAGTAVALVDAQFNGQSSDTSGFISVLTLTVVKHVEVLFDPISGNGYNGSGVRVVTVNPKSIPGAVVLYVVGVFNTTTAFTAQSVLIDDDVPNPSVLVGDQANPGTAVDVPTSVTMTVGGTPTTVSLDRASIGTNLDRVWVKGCAVAIATSQAFGGGTPEIDDAAIGTCTAGQTGYIAYLVTINDA